MKNCLSYRLHKPDTRKHFGWKNLSNSHYLSNNKQKANNNRSTTLERTPALYWYQILALDSAVVEVQECFSSHGSLLTNAMHHHGETP